ncbi:ribonuclease III [Patescibacteria group bacterium]|nr:ribonuclease III [Patescibacteria group bacterium]
MKDLLELEKQLNIKFKNKDLLTQAFVHRSFLNENTDFKLSHNERLEFLGDAVLELIVTEHLFLNYPDKSEGILTTWRASLVNTKMLSKMAKEIGFNDFLLLSQGEIKEEGRARQYILANTFESFVGALFLDQGLDICKKFIITNLVKGLPEIIKKRLFEDDKSSFQKEAQEKVGITPTYRVLNEEGPDHNKSFTVGVYLVKELIAEGKGASKQEAEESAAETALKIKNWNK